MIFDVAISVQVALFVVFRDWFFLSACVCRSFVSNFFPCFSYRLCLPCAYSFLNVTFLIMQEKYPTVLKFSRCPLSL